MEQAEKLCDALCIIARGEKVLDGRLSEVRKAHGGRHVILGVEEWVSGIAAVVDDRGLVSKADNYGNYSELELAAGADSQTLLRRLVQTGAVITKFEIAEASLTRIFMDKVGLEAATAAVNPEVRRA
jgi:ABC-2 type transport system ATP-binding protein